MLGIDGRDSLVVRGDDEHTVVAAIIVSAALFFLSCQQSKRKKLFSLTKYHKNEIKRDFLYRRGNNASRKRKNRHEDISYYFTIILIFKCKKLFFLSFFLIKIIQLHD